MSNELAFANPEAMQRAVKASDVLAEEFWGKLFGRHPGVQLLTISDMAARWIMNHPPETRSNAEKAIISSIVALTEIDQRHEHKKDMGGNPPD